MPLFFWFDLSLEARVEISEIFSLLFWDKRLLHKEILKLSDLYQIWQFSSTNQTFLKVEDKDFKKNSNTAVSLIGTRHQRHPENSTWNFKLKTQANLHGNLPYLNLNMSFFFLGIYHHRLSIGFGHGLNSIFGLFGWLFHIFYVHTSCHQSHGDTISKAR